MRKITIAGWTIEEYPDKIIVRRSNDKCGVVVTEDSFASQGNSGRTLYLLARDLLEIDGLDAVHRTERK